MSVSLVLVSSFGEDALMNGVDRKIHYNEYNFDNILLIMYNGCLRHCSPFIMILCFRYIRLELNSIGYKNVNLNRFCPSKQSLELKIPSFHL